MKRNCSVTKILKSFKGFLFFFKPDKVKVTKMVNLLLATIDLEKPQSGDKLFSLVKI